MGEDHYICNHCKKHISSYDEYEMCGTCDEYYCEFCTDSYVTVYASVGWICHECDNYGNAPEPDVYDICNFMIERYCTTYNAMKDAWKEEQEIQNMPCFRCEKDECVDSYSIRVKLTKDELYGLEHQDEKQYGCCCSCSDRPKIDWCEKCRQKKKIKI